MKISNKISLVTIGSILLIANAIPIGRYLSEKQSTNDAIKDATISAEKTSNIIKDKNQNVKTLPTSKLSNTSTPWIPFSEIGPTTNIKIKLTGPGSFWGISGFTYFLKYSTWEKKLIIQSNGTAMTMWNAVDHEITVGGDDSKNIEVAGSKIADTEVRIKSSGAGWAKMAINKDLKLPKDFKLKLANTTFSINASGTTGNPKIHYYYHILDNNGKSKPFWIATYQNFNFSQWSKDQWALFALGLFLLVIAILVTCVLIWSWGVAAADIPIFLEGDAAIIAEIVQATADDAIAAGVSIANAQAVADLANADFDANVYEAINYFFMNRFSGLGV